MMKVAYDHQAFVLQKFGGISRYFTKLVVNSTEDLVSSRVFAPRHQNQYLKDLPREMVVGDYTPSFLPKSWRIYDIYNKPLLSSRKILIYNKLPNSCDVNLINLPFHLLAEWSIR